MFDTNVDTHSFFFIKMFLPHLFGILYQHLPSYLYDNKHYYLYTLTMCKAA